ncbi:hypothetical protein EYF80_006596 [Liparis tanakae]|uniref:Uncharacterized protein n=1 Tax=Liparis tanakae TaxID=230148 RepID=A0A4Z2IYD3_9TELE|nr:hypothetical protein EYF80_006596 [Liparis tanakae]
MCNRLHTLVFRKIDARDEPIVLGEKGRVFWLDEFSGGLTVLSHVLHLLNSSQPAVRQDPVGPVGPVEASVYSDDTSFILAVTSCGGVLRGGTVKNALNAIRRPFKARPSGVVLVSPDEARAT